MSKPVVIVGASMGGLRTAESLRRFGYAGEIVAIGDEPYAPYNRPPLSKEVLAGEEVSHATVAFPQRPATEDVVWKLGKKVISADLDANTVTIDGGEKVEYSHLVIATGLRPKRQTYPNDIEKGRHVIRSLDDAIALRAELKPGAKVVVLGAGFIGCETAATAKKLGCDVTIVAPGALPIKRPLGEVFAAEVKRRQEAQGVKFLMETAVDDLVGTNRVTAVKLGNGEELACEVFIEAIGSNSNVEWLDGNDIINTDGVLCDSTLRAVKESGEVWQNVFVVGDVAKFPNPIFDTHARRVEHWNIPTECAKHVGQLIAVMKGAEGSVDDLLAKPFKPIPSFWSDQFDMHILAFGLLGLADNVELVQGEIDGDCVFEYRRHGELVGVAGIGLRSVVQGYRKEFER
ncbi:MAG: NAD(P)/FAD-dependent oxidoreductase [Rhodoluna sp.]